MADGSATAAQVVLKADRLSVRGAVTAATVSALLSDGRSAISGRRGQLTVLDLSGVTASDSTGLALVVDWIRTARAHDVALQIDGIPEQMNNIAAITGLGPLLANSHEPAQSGGVSGGLEDAS